MIDEKSLLRHPSLTKETDPKACGLSASGDTCHWYVIYQQTFLVFDLFCEPTVTSINFTYFQTLWWLILARSCSFVPIGTAWSNGSSFTWFDWFFKWCGIPKGFPLTVEAGGASLYRATSYSKRPGVSSTTPETRAPCGLWKQKNFIRIHTFIAVVHYKLPANPAALFCIIVGSGGLHIIISSWSDCITTPGNCGNQMRTWTKP